ncbi:hypothetical protein DKX38_013901 [Salix brachista]|uniref:Protein kinase domain-containing protein n=1 Tax=Salix brachista TaxID=2182728 RepID=A0A5N5LE03_9ROSI|nr:hypothetical protein DKX38_013901 [Salix brachista]
MYPNSETLCGGSGSICKSCRIERPLALPLPPITPPPPEEVQLALLVQSRNKLSLAFMIVGSLGAFAGINTIVYCLGGFLHKRYCNTVQPSITDVNVNTGASVSNHYITQPVRSFSIKSLGSTRLGFQRNGSSSRLTEKTQNFSLSELLAASNNFSLENKIDAGSFGTVYRGKLHGGREVAIKRGETGTKTRKFQEKESAFDSELALLPRLHHKNLLGLIGFCEENDERLLVYEIKIALDAARGIEYLHNYAVPPIIHRDIKSSNILLDSNWTAKVSDFGLSLMGPESDQQFMSTRAVGTVGYIDPEYYVLNVLTAKSDVYGLGVVLLELLTGKRVVFRNDEGGAGPMAIVDYATPLIAAGMLRSVLDERVGQPGMPETEAVELMAYTALHSIKLEGKERPNITDIVANLERALALCEEVHTSSSSKTFSIPSD